MLLVSTVANTYAIDIASQKQVWGYQQRRAHAQCTGDLVHRAEYGEAGGDLGPVSDATS